MSNLADLLKQISGSNSTAINLVGNVLGTLADVSGGVGAVVGLIGLFVANDDTIASRLNDIETEIQRDFAVLNAEQRAQNILNRLNSLDPPVAQTQTVVDQLQDDLGQNPPVSEEYRLQQIGLCLDAIEQLNQDDKWLSVFLDEIYYGQNETDWWAGTVAPTANADGTIFTDRYILPYYLRVL